MHILVWGLVGQLLAAIVLACSGLLVQVQAYPNSASAAAAT
jgi:hypothetical protein